MQPASTHYKNQVIIASSSLSHLFMHGAAAWGRESCTAHRDRYVLFPHDTLCVIWCADHHRPCCGQSHWPSRTRRER